MGWSTTSANGRCSLSDQVGIGASAALLHCFYWIRLKWVPVTSPFHSVFVAHLLFFASRVSFFFGGALFSAIFFRHLPELDALPPFAQACVKSVYVAATLFGLFCYSLELDRFGKAVEGRAAGPRPVASTSLVAATR
ncbi:hypothetical protein [Rhizobium leguminosarum]|uniref:hypothetical protein n=1 Tax=Rhizobium leguminosarum TaxID=384 RepID=UPI0021B10A7E|nr:hypothetical protein [Rhizobium leguminosarum]